MTAPNKKKRSLYIPELLLIEMQSEAERQDRSLSWMVQQAWKIARPEIKKLPSVIDVFSPSPPDLRQGFGGQAEG